MYNNVYGMIKVVHARSVLPSPKVLSFFFLFVHFSWESFLCISENVYEEAIRVFCSNLFCPAVPKGEEPILKSHDLNVSIELSLSYIHDMLNLLNKGNMFFFPPISLNFPITVFLIG